MFVDDLFVGPNLHESLLASVVNHSEIARVAREDLAGVLDEPLLLAHCHALIVVAEDIIHHKSRVLVEALGLVKTIGISHP